MCNVVKLTARIEVENAELSPDVKIFMQAGGTYVWGHKKFRDNNAKIATQIEMISTDAEGNPLTNEDGTYQKIQNNVITATNLQVNQWFLKNDVTWDEFLLTDQNRLLGRAVVSPWSGMEEYPHLSDFDDLHGIMCISL